MTKPNMVQVINGEIVRHQLPKTGKLEDGSTVSGYHLLDEETLQKEGWLPLEDEQPLHNAETHYVQFTGYDIQKDKVVRQYEIKEVPEPEPGTEERLLEVESRLFSLEQHLKLQPEA